MEEDKADRIWDFVQLNGKPNELMEQIRARGICEGNAVAQEGLKELETLFEFLEIFGTLDSVRQVR